MIKIIFISLFLVPHALTDPFCNTIVYPLLKEKIIGDPSIKANAIVVDMLVIKSVVVVFNFYG